MGLSYFVTKWFRYFLVDWIKWRMGEIETLQGLLQLEHRCVNDPPAVHSGENNWDPTMPNSTGDLAIAQSGRVMSADMSLLRWPLDVGILSLEWVNHKSDGLFGGLSRGERHLLFCIFSREMDWAEIAQTFDVSIREVKRRYEGILAGLRKRGDSAQSLPQILTSIQMDSAEEDALAAAS